MKPYQRTLFLALAAIAIAVPALSQTPTSTTTVSSTRTNYYIPASAFLPLADEADCDSFDFATGMFQYRRDASATADYLHDCDVYAPLGLAGNMKIESITMYYSDPSSDCSVYTAIYEYGPSDTNAKAVVTGKSTDGNTATSLSAYGTYSLPHTTSNSKFYSIKANISDHNAPDDSCAFVGMRVSVSN